MSLSAVYGILTHWVVKGHCEKEYPSFYLTEEYINQIGYNPEKIKIINVIFDDCEYHAEK